MKIALTFDVEKDLHSETYLSIKEGMNNLLLFFDEENIRATFFVPATLLEKFPNYFKNLNKKEIGSFGDAAIFSFSKVFNWPLGGAYLKNKGKIKIKPLNYSFSKLDLLNFMNKNKASNFLKKFMKIFIKKEKIKINPSKIKIKSLPRFYLNKKISLDKINPKLRKVKAEKLANKFKHFKQVLSKKNNFFYSLPLLTNNREELFDSLIKKGARCNKMWNNPLSLDKELDEKFNLKKTPNAEKFSREIINLLIN